MTTTKVQLSAATLRTTILLATLVGHARRYRIHRQRRPEHRAAVPGSRVAMNFFSYFFSDKIALKMSGAQPMEESENAGLLPDGP